MKRNEICAAVLVLSTLSAAAYAQAPGAATGPTGAAPTQSTSPALAGGPSTPPASAATLGASDKKFFVKAAGGGLAEVAAGQLASQTSANPDVKSFADQMVKDHTKANDELTQLAQTKGVTLPQAPDASHQKDLDKLKQKQGAAFDKAYVKAQIADHKSTISLFEQASKSKDPDIAAFAQKTLPTLKMHLVMVKGLQKKLPG
jgi:putative membrane protein